MNWKRVAGLILIVISGILSCANFIFTGAVIGVNSVSSLIVILMFIAGLILVIISKDLGTIIREESARITSESPQSAQYYKRRIKEMLSYEGDTWVALGETPGIFRELKKQGYLIEHGIEKPTIHRYGSRPKTENYAESRQGYYKNIMHVEISGIGKNKGIKKHLLISRDPYDPRIRNQAGLDFRKEPVKRIPSRVYRADYPRTGVPSGTAVS